MSYWIDYEMLKAEINLHRDNAQRIIKSYHSAGRKHVSWSYLGKQPMESRIEFGLFK